jgi:hypothetical protein
MGVVVVTHRSRRRPIPGAEAKLRALSIHWRPLHFLNAIERLQAKALAEGSNASEAPELIAHFGVCRFAASQSASAPGLQF